MAVVAVVVVVEHSQSRLPLGCALDAASGLDAAALPRGPGQVGHLTCVHAFEHLDHATQRKLTAERVELCCLQHAEPRP